METYILSKNDLKIQSLCKISDYAINLDEETNSKTQFQMLKTDGLEDGNFIVVNGLYKQFLFVIPKDGVSTEKGSKLATVTALDISNIFDRKVIEKNIEEMQTKSIEEFIANTMYENFVNSDDSFLNINYIDIYWHTNTQGSVATNAENGLYNFHTFLTNCRQYKNIYTDFKFENGRLRIDIQYKEEETVLIDTTLPEVVGYNKIYEEDVTAKVQCYIREDGSEYNLYLKTDRTTTTNKDDPNRARGKIEVISVDIAENAPEQALNVMKGNNYKHLVEFKIAKTSKLMDITKLTIGRPIRIRTEDSIYDSYISAITLTDENFVYFKSGSLRMNLIDKLKKTKEGTGNKLDVSGGVIKGNLKVTEEVVAKILEANKILTSEGIESNGDIIIKNARYLKGEDLDGNLFNLIRAYNAHCAVGDSKRVARIYSSEIPTFSVGGVIYTPVTTEELYYKKGDKITLGNIAYLGHITSSCSQVLWNISTLKRLDNITNITVKSMVANIRHPDGGYLTSNTDLLTIGTVTTSIPANNSIRILFKPTTAYTSFTNNVPLSVDIRSCEIEFG